MISSSLTALPLTHVFPRNGSGPLLERSRQDKYSPKSDRPNMEAEPFSQLFLDEKKIPLVPQERVNTDNAIDYLLLFSTSSKFSFAPNMAVLLSLH